MAVKPRSILIGAGWLLGLVAVGVFVTTLLSSSQQYQQAPPADRTASRPEPDRPALLPVTPKHVALGPLKEPRILVEKSGRPFETAVRLAIAGG